MSSLEDFEVVSKLGSGSFSEVFQVKRKCDGQYYAMKKVKMGMLKEKEKENALNEVRILASLNQKYIIGYKEAIYDEETQTLSIVMEYADQGDITKLIKQKINTKTYICESEIWRALIHMAYGLKTLHDKKILHRDLKCANVFKCEDTYKLGDLNVSKIAKRGFVYTQTGTPYYASPEVWRDEPYDTKSDIWSLGCVIYEMCALKPPFLATDMASLYVKIQKGQYPSIPNRYSNELSQVISQLLRLNASTRPNCDQILSNPNVQKMGQQYLEESHAYINKSQLQLLKTIQLPKNGLQGLSEKLPGKKYDEEKPENKENNNIFRIQAQLQLKLNKRSIKRSLNVQHLPEDYNPINCNPSQRLINQLHPNRAGQHLIIRQKPPIKQLTTASPAVSNNVSLDQRMQRINSLQEGSPSNRQVAPVGKISNAIKISTLENDQIVSI